MCLPEWLDRRGHPPQLLPDRDDLNPLPKCYPESFTIAVPAPSDSQNRT